MQTQDAPVEFLFKLWPKLEANKTPLLGGLAVILVASGIWFIVSSQRDQKEVEAGQALTMDIVNPALNNDINQMASALEQVASTYSGTMAGQRAQLQAGSALYDAGKYSDAQAQFEKFLAADSTSPLAAVALLGKAASLEAQTKLDSAVPVYNQVISQFVGSPSAQSAEFALGRIAEAQNKLSEAKSHYDNVTHFSLRTQTVEEAARRSAELNARITAAAAKSPAAAQPAAAKP